MPTLSHPDPTAAIACTLPVNEYGDRLRSLETIVAGRLEGVTREASRIRIRIARQDGTNLEQDLTDFAEAEKACCAFLGFAIEPEVDAVTLEIVAADGAEPTLDGIEWLVRAAGAAEAGTHPGAAA